MSYIQDLDVKILFFIYNNMHSDLLDKIMIFFTGLGEYGAIWLTISGTLLMLPKYRRVGVLTLCAVILSYISGELILKNIIERPRPFIAVPAVNMLITKPLTYSFPSGHTATAFAAGIVLYSQLDKYKVSFLILAVLIAFSRMYLFVHYPTDIVGGITLGVIISSFVLYISKVVFVKSKENTKKGL